jgi:hypothetical protein
MWICQSCHTAYDDTTDICVPCARVNDGEPAPSQPPRQVRGFGFLLASVIACAAIGFLSGWMLDSQKTPLPATEESSPPVARFTGAAFGAAAGVLVWASFPYKRSRPTAPVGEPHDDTPATE